MKRTVLLIIAFVVGASAVSLLGQAQPAQKPLAFEVASIKPTSDDDRQFVFRIEPDGTTTAAGITLKRLIMTAYGVQGFRIIGAPGWISSTRWDVQAKHSGLASPDQIHRMLRTLLEQRVQLHAHSDTRNLPIYELVVDRDRSKVVRTRDVGAMPTVRVAPGSIHLTNAAATTFASQLSYAVARPVIDKTRLTGTFDFGLEWTPIAGEDDGPTTVGLPPRLDEPPSSSVEGPSIFTAIREQLGLRLKAARGPVDVLVIDHVERPTPD